MQRSEQPPSFLAVPTIWRSLLLLLSIYGMCSVHFKCAKIETAGKKFATCHSHAHCPRVIQNLALFKKESVHCFQWWVCQNPLIL